MKSSPVKINKAESLIVFLLAVILAMGAALIFRRPQPVPLGSDEKRLRDSIALYLQQRDRLQADVDRMYRLNDSLMNLEASIKIKYRDKIRYIQGATPDQLDSVIRSVISSGR